MTIEKLTIRLILFLVIITLLILGKPLIVPIVVALLVWMLIDALATKLKSIKIFEIPLPKWLISLGVILVFSFLLLFFYQVMIIQTDKLVAAAPFYQEKFAHLIVQLSQLTGLKLDVLVSELFSNINITELLAYVADSTQSMLSSVFLVTIYLAFLFIEQSHAKAKIIALKNLSDRFTLIQSIFKSSTLLIKRYIRLKSAISALTSLLCYLVFVMFDVDFAELWAISTFLLNFIPNIGSALAVFFPSILISLQFDSLSHIALIITCLVIIQFVIGNIIEPAIMGKSLNLSAFMILISLSFWGFIWGIAGMFLAIPLMVATAILFSHIDETKWIAILMSADGQLLIEQDNRNSKT
ncbi:AI-2E family transporter [Colwellia piezophila]|uniref:AI-2E family transporter n=1 Tax=Colwellia piezophila TaxID=211668 RepID=UPI000366267E|nr:AI-2E family transporter [Colwellia piezophila]